MAAVCNGIALHGGLRPYNATFLVFHDYHRPAVRMSAQMHLPVLYLYSHDSLFLGEDGPTHQPEATLLALRALPGVRVIRPADGPETVAAWQLALQRRDGPTALILSRQDLPTLAPDAPLDQTVGRGGYTVRAELKPDLVLIGTGSEVGLCRQAADLLAAEGVAVQVVSMPCRELFLEQDAAWREAVLPSKVPRLAVEAAVTLGWERWVGADGEVVGLDSYGASAPAADLARRFGFTPDQVAARARALLARVAAAR
jgi:transketolase